MCDIWTLSAVLLQDMIIAEQLQLIDQLCLNECMESVQKQTSKTKSEPFIGDIQANHE